MFPEQFTVYCIRHTDSGRMYFGQTSSTLADRWRGHLLDARRGKKTGMAVALREHGADAFDVQAVLVGVSSQDASAWEQTLIASYSEERLFNRTAGGAGTFGMKHTPEAIAKISEASKRAHTPERRAKTAAQAKARWADPECRERMRAAQSAGRFGKPTIVTDSERARRSEHAKAWWAALPAEARKARTDKWQRGSVAAKKDAAK